MIDTRDTAQALELNSHYDREATVPQLFLEAVTYFPAQVALEGEEGVLSYADLLCYAQQVLQLLRSQNVGQGALVGIVNERRFATIGAMLGILMAGAAYVPIDLMGQPLALIEQQLAQCGIHLLLGEASQVRSLHFLQCATLWLPTLNAINMPIVGSELLPPGQSAEDVAYVMFTSGSTGAPKGVMVPHRGIVRLVAAQQYLAFGPGQTFLLHSPLNFDASTLELWGALLHGGRLVLAPARPLAIADYREWIRARRVTTLWLTAALFHLIADHDLQAFAPLQQLIVGGDVISPARVRAVQKAFPALSIVNGYGPTENTTFTACYRIPSPEDDSAALPIGAPIQHTRVYVLDEQRRPVLPGVSGELAAAGDGLALGYVGDPERTAARFITQTIEGVGPERMYLTGDRVRRDEAGTLHFLGRLDREVKIAGQRVNLSQVEELLTLALAGRQCVVETVERPGQEKQVIAFQQGTGSPELERQLREQLAGQLPRAAVPAVFVFLPSLPLSPNGKIDREKLRAEYGEARNQQGSASSPVPDKNQEGQEPDPLAAVSNIWSALLDRPAVQPDDNFFDVGGDSLLLIQMHLKLNQLGVKIDLMDLFQATTPRQIAELLLARRSGAKNSAA
jgi:amino acid adenylation domain-containing protein